MSRNFYSKRGVQRGGLLFGLLLFFASFSGCSMTQGVSFYTDPDAWRLEPSEVRISADAFVEAGTCAPVTLELYGADGLATYPKVATVVSLANTGSGGFYLDGNCAQGASSVQMPFRASSAVVYFSQTLPGSPILQASSTGLAGGSDTLTVGYLAVASLDLQGPSSQGTSDCGLLTVTQKSASSTLTKSSNPMAVTLGTSGSGSSSGAFYSNASCSNALGGSVVIPAHQGTASFYYRQTTGGAVVLQASYLALSDSLSLTVYSSAPTQLALSGSASLQAHACGAYSVLTQDGGGNGVPAQSTTVVSLSTLSTGVGFYADSSCTQAISQVSIPTGSSSVPFYLKRANALSPAVLQASASGLASASLSVAIVAPPASQLTWSGPGSGTTTDCLAFDLGVSDSSGNSTLFPSSASIALSSAGVGAFYSSSSCSAGSQTSAVAATAGASSVSVYYKRTSAGTSVLTASATGLTSGTATLLISTAPATQLSITGPSAIGTSQCAAFTVKLLNADGVLAAWTQSASVTLGGASGTGAFYSNSSCSSLVSGLTIPQGSTSGTFYYSQTASSPNLTLTAQATGLTSGSFVLSLGAGPATILNITASSTSFTTVDCQRLSVSFKDASLYDVVNSNAATLSFSVISGSGAIYSNATCTTPMTQATAPAGAWSFENVYFKSTSATTATVQVTAVSMIADTQVLSVTLAPPVKLSVAASGGTSVLAGACTFIGVYSQNSASVNSAVSSPVTYLVSDSSVGGSFYSNLTDCNNQLNAANSGTISTSSSSGYVYYRLNSAASGLILSFTDQAGNLQAASLTLNVSSNAGTQLVFSSGVSGIVSALTCGSLTVQVRNSSNTAITPSPSVPVNLSQNGSAQFYSSSACSAGTEISSVTVSASSGYTFYVKGHVAGTVTLTASDPNSVLTSATRSISYTSGVASKLVYTNAPSSGQNITGGTCRVFTVAAQDEGNLTASVGTSLSVLLSSTLGTTQFFSNSACTSAPISSITLTGSSAGSFYVKDSAGGTLTVTASDSQSVLTSASRTFTFLGGTPSQIAFSSGSTTLSMGVCTAYSVLLMDSSSNTVAPSTTLTYSLSDGSRSGTFHSASGCSAGSTITQLNQTSGSISATFYYKPTLSGSTTLTVSSSGLTSATRTLTVTPVASQLAFLSPPASVAVGVCTGFPVQIRASDGAVATLTSTRTFTFSGLPSGASFFLDSACSYPVTTVNGYVGDSLVPVYVYRTTATGSATLSVSASGLSGATTSVSFP